ncbi:MAG: uridine kinase [Bacteroidia bacterium]
MSHGIFVVGLTGGSASGKTTFVNQLKEYFNEEQLAIISLDNYYKPISLQFKDEMGEVNFDRPEAIDFERVVRDVKLLRKGKKVEMVEYTFNDSSKFPKSLLINSAPIILVEGLFVFSDSKLRKMFDWTLFLEADHSIAKNRRVARDTKERGMDEKVVHYQWENHVLPAYQNHLKPYRVDSDLIIDNNQHFSESLKIVINRFEEVLRL